MNTPKSTPNTQSLQQKYAKSQDIAQKRPGICEKENRFLELCLKIKGGDLEQCRQYVEMRIYCQKSKGSYLD